MTSPDVYKLAYEREKKARLLAERLLDEKTRSLYDNLLKLESTITELKSTKKQLIQADKMASLGQLAAGIAHEINNPIGYSISNLSVLVKYIDSLIALDDFMTANLARLPDISISQSYKKLRELQEIDYIRNDIPQLMDETQNGLLKVKEIVSNLKKVSHSGGLEKECHDINALIDESLNIVWNELKHSVKVEKDLRELPPINCHGTEIQQVLINLFVNAAHATMNKGILTISTDVIQKDAIDYLRIEITDNGKGISEKVIDKIFDPFYTTKPVGKGTGLGLSISFGIIEKHGGKLLVNSIENKGATFKIELPY